MFKCQLYDGLIFLPQLNLHMSQSVYIINPYIFDPTQPNLIQLKNSIKIH